MPSPFPGMDPYVERHWRDIHTVLVAYTRDRLNGSLPSDLIARTEERIAIEPEDGLRSSFVRDVHVAEQTRRKEPGDMNTATAVAEPIVLLAHVEPATERYVTILNAETEKLVTVLEFLRPSNKRGEGLREYKAKRRELYEAGVHLVEIDLVRQGDWKALLLPHAVHPRHHTPYRVTIRPAREPGRVDYYPISLRQRLPIIPIPLREHDPLVTLDLQPLVEQAYQNGRYDRTRYDVPLDPPLDPDDVQWVEQLLRSREKR